MPDEHTVNIASERDFYAEPEKQLDDSDNEAFRETAYWIAEEHVELRRIIQLLIVTGKVEPETVREARDLARMLE